MSRSKHTDPRLIQAERRLHAPRDARSVGDLSQRRHRGKLRKERGVVIAQAERLLRHPPRARLQIIIRTPRSGFHHPAGKADILQVLDALGPGAIHGLRVIELARSPAVPGSGMPLAGRYYAPGRIKLYEQLLAPWRLAGLLTHETIHRFQKAGAIVTLLNAVGATLVRWPANMLRRFMLEQVLLHEIGHHILQHNKGKRPVRIARTRDHEAFAVTFARANRAAVSKRLILQ
jgi:hypothetical protein